VQLYGAGGRFTNRPYGRKTPHSFHQKGAALFIHIVESINNHLIQQLVPADSDIADSYVHETDKTALKALKSIPGFHQFVKAFMKIWSERQFRISNMSSCVRMGDNQLSKYYNMLPPICHKLGIDVPDLYLQLNVVPNSYTSGDTKPFIVVTSGLFETIPEALIPTVLAHECGHIACHHVLYSTMGNILLNGTSLALRNFIPYGSVATMPLEIAFFYWMRCSELSADRAAVLCDGSSVNMKEVCMRLAGYDKDIDALASTDEFMVQAKEYREMIRSSKWDKTLEFLALRNLSHPLMTVRALECDEWANSEQYRMILNGKWEKDRTESIEELTDIALDDEEKTEKASKPKYEFPSVKKRTREQEDVREAADSIPDEIRKYKKLFDDEIITKEEFIAKKKQLLKL